MTTENKIRVGAFIVLMLLVLAVFLALEVSAETVPVSDPTPTPTAQPTAPAFIPRALLQWENVQQYTPITLTDGIYFTGYEDGCALFSVETFSVGVVPDGASIDISLWIGEEDNPQAWFFINGVDEFHHDKHFSIYFSSCQADHDRGFPFVIGGEDDLTQVPWEWGVSDWHTWTMFDSTKNPVGATLTFNGYTPAPANVLFEAVPSAPVFNDPELDDGFFTVMNPGSVVWAYCRGDEYTVDHTVVNPGSWELVTVNCGDESMPTQPVIDVPFDLSQNAVFIIEPGSVADFACSLVAFNDGPVEGWVQIGCAEQIPGVDQAYLPIVNE